MVINVKHNAKRNILVGLLNKIVLLILPFFTKSIINVYLGSEYLGLNSLFSSILSVLSLTELGIGSAMVYHMYKPIAEDDYQKIGALLNFYRKTYFIIGVATLCMGMVFFPFLPNLIKGSYPTEINIYVVYLFQLVSNLIGYFLFGYRQSLLVAYQRDDINSWINLLTQGGLQVTQLILLVRTHNYYTYVICMPLFTVINNLWVGCMTNKMFPMIKCHGKVEGKTYASIKKLVAGSFIQKACAVTRNSLDSICISSFVGLAVVGMYNNYYTIFNGVTVVLTMLISSVIGGIGNHIALKSREENFREMKLLDFLYLTLSGWATCCLLCLSQPFMKVWMGSDMLLPESSIILMCIYFYTLKVGDVRGIYYSTTGMWWEMRYRSVAETIGNLILNIALGKIWGINGIILATILSLIFFNFLWGSNIVFRNYFGMEKLKKYFIYQGRYFAVTIVVCVITYFVVSGVVFESFLLELIVKGGLCGFLSAMLYAGIYYKTDLGKETLKILKEKMQG